MSGIYIPGMELPADGFITVTITSDGRVVGNSKKESGKFEYLCNEDIASAIPVPDHGRLIDADALFDARYDSGLYRNVEICSHQMVVDWEDIEDAPTIIPASEEKKTNDEDDSWCQGEVFVVDLLRAPSADVAPVRHGRWNVSRTDYGWNCSEFPTHCKCSLCGREIPYQDQDNYCPNCGAKMDGGET